MVRNRKSKIKLAFLLSVFGWILIWTLGFLNYFVGYLNAHPGFSPIAAWLIHQTGYFISFAVIGLISTGKLNKVTRFTLGANLVFIALEISIPPLCVSTDGNLLLTAENQSCLMGNDTLVSSFLSLIVPYGTSLMYYLTYIIGTLVFAISGIYVLSDKELWAVLVKGWFK